jgi:hypothetical protein
VAREHQLLGAYLNDVGTRQFQVLGSFVNATSSANAPSLTAALGTFTLTGRDAAFLAGRVLTAERGAFTLDGKVATLTYSGALVTEIQFQIPGGMYLNHTGEIQFQLPGGSFVNSPTVIPETDFVAEKGTFSLTGNAASLTYSGVKTLTAERGPFILTGNAASLISGPFLSAGVGSFALEVAPSNSDHEHDEVTGSFALTGQAAVLRHGHRLTAASNAFVLTGNEVTFAVSSEPTAPLQAETGTFTLSGKDATLSRVSTTMEAESGTFTLTGGVIPGSLYFSVDSGAFVLTGNDSELTFAGKTVWTRRGGPSTASTWTRVT